MKYVRDIKRRVSDFKQRAQNLKNRRAGTWQPKDFLAKASGVIWNLTKALLQFTVGLLAWLWSGIASAFGKLRRATKTRPFWTWTLRIAAVGFAFIAFLFIYYSYQLPDPNKLLSRSIPQSTKIFSRDGILLYEIHGEYKRTLIPFSEMNDYMKHATIAIEDKNFYNEGGISFTGIARSILVNVMRGEKAQGGSTITQQFVRSAMLSREKALSRKIKEIILSIEIDKRFSKDDILKLYLNEISYGRNLYGIEAASQVYFSKRAKDLTLAEAAYLAAIPQSPTYYNPSGPHRADLDFRKNLVLNAMLDQKYISAEEHEKAKAEQVTFQKAVTGIKAPHFVFYIQNYLAEKYGEQTLETGGLKVTTTLDYKLQEIAERVVKEGAATNVTKYNGNNAALVAIDPKTGQILAMVGSKDYLAKSTPEGCTSGLNCNFEADVNAALSPLQPGSSVKPYVYVTAFKPEFGASPATLRLDVVTNFGNFGGKNYIPKNYDGRERGPLSMRESLAQSLNVPAVKTLALVGVENAKETMRDVGITTELKDCALSLVLGGCEVRLLDHVGGYATFATMGIYHEKTGILSVEDASGRRLEDFEDKSKAVIDPQSVYELVNIMTDNAARTPVFGANSPLILSDRPVAAKTGTTQNWHDGWALGFTPSLAAGVWVGNNDGTLLKRGADGVLVAAPIWHNFMAAALKGTPVEAFAEPNGIQRITVDALSGKLPGPYTQNTKNEVFASFSVPTEIDDTHIMVDGQVITVLRSEKPNDPNWEAAVAAWAPANGYVYMPLGGEPVNPQPAINPSGETGSTPIGNPPTVVISSPADNSTIESLPFSIQATATPDTGNQIVRMDLFIDGAVVQTVNSSPYTFIVSQGVNSGTHTIAVQAADDKSNSADTSITIKVK